MLVQQKDAAGNPVVDAAGQPVMVEVPDVPAPGANAGGQNGTITVVEAERLARDSAERARAEEKRKLYGDLERERTERATLQAQLEARDRAEKERQLAALPAEQQTAARLTQLGEDLARERGERLADQARSTQALRAVGLVAYRERALRDVPTEVHDLVGGDSEEEIDTAVDTARNIFSNLENRLRTQLAQEYEARRVAPPPGGGPPPPGTVPAPPHNPAYVAPHDPQSLAGPGGGFPVRTNPIPVVEGQPQLDIHEMTSEQAVRSGRYGGEMRERLHQQLRGNTRYPGALGSAPRHWSQQTVAQPLPQQEMPGGVLQPQGTPMGPVTPAGMAQPYNPGGGGTPDGQPQARSRDWLGGTLGQPSGVQVRPDARSAHASRFTHTPPITQ